ncbi:MAG: hypothetical protein J6W33_02520 [Spirochaetia bacterium]|nr:hypothetical protein [Spirochaetia bacterium]
MIVYMGYRFYYLGLKRWRVSAPESEYTFDVIFKDGITELMDRAAMWKEVTGRYEYNRT